jgi:uncharacterized protein YndB with AHSA1/START domain
VSTTRIERHIHAPRDRVYAALLDAHAVQQWMVPDGMTSEVHVFEPRQGGAVRISLTYEDPTRAGKSSRHTDTYHGTFTRLVPNTEVVQRIEFESDDPSSQGTNTITMRLSDDPHGGTRLSATHEGVPSGVKPEDNELGWSLSLQKLARLLEDA